MSYLFALTILLLFAECLYGLKNDVDNGCPRRKPIYLSTGDTITDFSFSTEDNNITRHQANKTPTSRRVECFVLFDLVTKRPQSAPANSYLTVVLDNISPRLSTFSWPKFVNRRSVNWLTGTCKPDRISPDESSKPTHPCAGVFPWIELLVYRNASRLDNLLLHCIVCPDRLGSKSNAKVKQPANSVAIPTVLQVSLYSRLQIFFRYDLSSKQSQSFHARTSLERAFNGDKRSKLKVNLMKSSRLFQCNNQLSCVMLYFQSFLLAGVIILVLVIIGCVAKECLTMCGVVVKCPIVLARRRYLRGAGDRIYSMPRCYRCRMMAHDNCPESSLSSDNEIGSRRERCECLNLWLEQQGMCEECLKENNFCFNEFCGCNHCPQHHNSSWSESLLPTTSRRPQHQHLEQKGSSVEHSALMTPPRHNQPSTSWSSHTIHLPGSQKKGNHARSWHSSMCDEACRNSSQYQHKHNCRHSFTEVHSHKEPTTPPATVSQNTLQNTFPISISRRPHSHTRNTSSGVQRSSSGHHLPPKNLSTTSSFASASYYSMSPTSSIIQAPPNHNPFDPNKPGPPLPSQVQRTGPSIEKKTTVS